MPARETQYTRCSCQRTLAATSQRCRKEWRSYRPQIFTNRRTTPSPLRQELKLSLCILNKHDFNNSVSCTSAVQPAPPSPRVHNCTKQLSTSESLSPPPTTTPTGLQPNLPCLFYILSHIQTKINVMLPCFAVLMNCKGVLIPS